MFDKTKLLLTAGALLAASSAGAVDPHLGVGSGHFTFGISGFVPVICRANVDATSVAPRPGNVSLGALTEFCNSPNGYDVYADYSASLATASLIVDGTAVPLSATGSTRVTQSDRAAIDSHDLVLDLPAEAASSAQISFRIVPR